jgi:PAS domain-containing protein
MFNKNGIIIFLSCFGAMLSIMFGLMFLNHHQRELVFFSFPVVIFHFGLLISLSLSIYFFSLQIKKRKRKLLLNDFQKLFHHFSNPVLILDKEQEMVVKFNLAALQWLELKEEKVIPFSQLGLGELKQETLVKQRPNKGHQTFNKQIYPLALDGQNFLLLMVDVQQASKKSKPAIPVPSKALPFEETIWISLTITGEIIRMSERFKSLIRMEDPKSFLDLLRPQEKKKFTEAIQHFLLGKSIENNFITRLPGKNGMVDIAWELQWSGDKQVPGLSMVGVDLTRTLTTWREEKTKWEQHETFWSKVPMNGWTVDFNSLRLLYGTEGAKKLFGISIPEFQENPNHWLNMVVPEDRNKVYDTLKALERNNEAHYFYRIVTPEGTQKTIESHQFIERSEDGIPLKIHGISFEAPLQEKESVLQFEYLDAIHLPLCIIGKSGKILFANNELSQSLQVPKSELLDRSITQFMPPEQWHEIESELLQEFRGALTKEIHWLPLKGPSETKINRFQHGILLRLNKSDVRLHRHQPDKAVLQMFRRIISNSPDLIWSINLNLEIQVANQPFLEATQMSQGTVHEGWYLHGLVHDHMAMNWWLEKLNKVFDGATIREEFDLKSMGWKGDVAEFLLFPIHDADQRISGAGCIARNISHFKRLELGLRDRNQALENLLYHTSHHLRAPLANAMGLIAMLKENESPSPLENEAKEKLNDSLIKLDQIIRSSIQQSRNMLLKEDPEGTP